jgi:hypothetical protein
LRSPLHVVNHVNVKYTNDSSIFEGMVVVMSGQGHDISMVAWINCILPQTNIIGSVVDPHDFVHIKTAVYNANLPMFLC